MRYRTVVAEAMFAAIVALRWGGEQYQSLQLSPAGEMPLRG